MRTGVRFGQCRGRLDRSLRPSAPSSLKRCHHLDAQRREMPIARATWAIGAGLDAPAQQQSTLRGERSVTVSHGDLRFGVLASTTAHLLPEVSRFSDYRVTNVRGRNT
jgi:hypothetical protein